MGKINEVLKKYNIEEAKGKYLVVTKKKSDIAKTFKSMQIGGLGDLEDDYGWSEKDVLKHYWPVTGPGGGDKTVPKVPAGAKEKLITVAGLVAGDIATPEMAAFVQGDLAYVDAEEYESEIS